MSPQTDVNLTEIMKREGIHTITQWAVGPFTVVLKDARCGTADTVGAALAKAKADDMAWLRVAS